MSSKSMLFSFENCSHALCSILCIIINITHQRNLFGRFATRTGFEQKRAKFD